MEELRANSFGQQQGVVALLSTLTGLYEAQETKFPINAPGGSRRLRLLIPLALPSSLSAPHSLHARPVV